VSKARSLGVTRGGEAALPNFLPLNTAPSITSASLSISQLYAQPKKQGNRFWVSIVILGCTNACMQASMRLTATESRDERPRKLGTPLFSCTPFSRPQRFPLVAALSFECKVQVTTVGWCSWFQARHAKLARACSCDVKRRWDATSILAVPRSHFLRCIARVHIFNDTPLSCSCRAKNANFILFYFPLSQ